MHKSDELKVIVLDSGVDIEEIERVKIIRIKSGVYNFLIFKDYWRLSAGVSSILGCGNYSAGTKRGSY